MKRGPRRLGNDYSGACSVNELAALLGVPPARVRRWIGLGWLQTDQRIAEYHPARLTYTAVREFLLAHPTEVSPRHLPEDSWLWLVDLLSDGHCGMLVEDAKRPVGVPSTHCGEIRGYATAG